MSSFGPHGNSSFSVIHAEARASAEVRMLAWNVPPEELQHIPEHWFKFQEPPAAMHNVLVVVYTFFMIAALTGNGLVLWVFTSAKSLRTPSNVLVINLAFCDFIMMCKAPIFIYNSMHRGFALGHLGCQVFAFIGSISGIVGGMTNAAIAYDRYNVITSPMDGKMTMGKSVMMVVVIYIYAAPLIIAPLTKVWGRYVPEGYLTSCTFDYLTDNDDTRFFVGTIFTFSYVMPVLMIMFFYSHIVGHVFNHEKQLREQAKKMNVESLRSNVDASKETAEIRIAKAAITVCFLFLLSWTPYGMMSLIGAFGNKDLLTPGVTMIPACTCKLVACIDPYVYAISHPRYRLELQKRLPWLALDEKEPDAASTSSTATVTASPADSQQTTAA